MASPPHRQNILNSRFREVGIGVVVGAPRRNVFGLPAGHLRHELRHPRLSRRALHRGFAPPRAGQQGTMTALQTLTRAEVPAPPAPDQPLPDPRAPECRTPAPSPSSPRRTGPSTPEPSPPDLPEPGAPDAPQPDPKGPETA